MPAGFIQCTIKQQTEAQNVKEEKDPKKYFLMRD